MAAEAVEVAVDGVAVAVGDGRGEAVVPAAAAAAAGVAQRVVAEPAAAAAAAAAGVAQRVVAAPAAAPARPAKQRKIAGKPEGECTACWNEHRTGNPQVRHEVDNPKCRIYIKRAAAAKA